VAYNIQHSAHYEHIKIPTKCIAAEDTSRDPNTNFINFTNFINVTIFVINILNVLATFITHLTHIIWNILKLLLILDFKVCQSSVNLQLHVNQWHKKKLEIHP
jgi:hypothetical protein